ncbi:uncharacterized protein YeaO (DUF488 family) [Streptacidiphilus sp. MAP12-20]|uniref:DUF488 domain-containing protein n=1 Tax=Streptacidiphilus sp. MAP12-20 TaxID=3156299 RepID=UPI00351781DD
MPTVVPVRIRRVYDPPVPQDGARILVDRLWPRGVSKADAHLDAWPKAVTPSTELRRWFHGPDGTFAEFRSRYEAELEAPEAAAALEQLRRSAADGQITLLTAAKEPEHSHAAVLQELLNEAPTLSA